MSPMSPPLHHRNGLRQTESYPASEVDLHQAAATTTFADSNLTMDTDNVFAKTSAAATEPNANAAARRSIDSGHPTGVPSPEFVSRRTTGDSRSSWESLSSSAPYNSSVASSRMGLHDVSYAVIPTN